MQCAGTRALAQGKTVLLLCRSCGGRGNVVESVGKRKKNPPQRHRDAEKNLNHRGHGGSQGERQKDIHHKGHEGIFDRRFSIEDWTEGIFD
jgi:hypothetical protein